MTLFVVGMHRSGTSAICRLLEHAGIDFGDNLIPPADDNPLGFWEDRQFISLNNQLLGGERAWMQVSVPDVQQDDGWEHSAQAFLDGIIEARSAESFGFGLKDPRVCRTLSRWLNLVQQPKILFAVRNPLSVAHSLYRRDGFGIEHGLALWFVYNYEALRSLQSSSTEFCIANYDRLMDSDSAEREEICSYLDLPHIDFSLLEGKLRHQKFESASFDEADFVQKLAARLWESIDRGNPDYRKFSSAYESLLRIYTPLREVSEDLDELSGYVSHLETDLGELRKHLAEERKEKRALETFTDDLSKQVDELQAVYQSKSWRMTAPLRDSRRFLRMVSNRGFSILRWFGSFLFRKLSTVQTSRLVSSRQNATALQALVDNRALEKYWNPFPEVEKEKLPVIGLSVVMHNNGQWLETFIDSLVGQNYPLDHIRLVFIDNASTDDTPEKLEKLKLTFRGVFAEIEVVQRPNLGFGCGHHYAIQMLDVDYVLVSNVDLEFQKDAIVGAVATAMSDNEVASWEFRQSPYEHPKYVDPVTLQVNWSSHACILLDRRAYFSVGGYEKRIFMYGEDVELSYRFRRAGYHLKYLPRSVVFHHTYESKGEIKPLQFYGSVSANFLIRCRYGNPTDILVGYLLILGLAIRGAGFAGSRKLIWQTLPGTLSKAPAFLASRKKSKAAFPFRGFDYDLIRDGAFWESDRGAIEKAENLPLVTVITRTVEGREALLNQAIVSVMNQAYPAIEHIIAEDGGESVAELCARLHSISPESYKIRHIACEKKGRSHAANHALNTARGEFVVILDDDDLLLPDHIETLVTEVIRSEADAAYSLAWDTPVHYSDKAQGKYSEHAHITLPLFYQEFDRETLFHHNFLPIQSVLFRRDLLGDSIRFDEDLHHLEDWVFWKRISKNADFRFVPKTTSLYKTPLSAGENFKRKRLLDDAYAVASKRPEN